MQLQTAAIAVPSCLLSVFIDRSSFRVSICGLKKLEFSFLKNFRFVAGVTSRRLDFRTKAPFNAAFFKYFVVGKASSLLFQTKGDIILKDAEPWLLAVIDVHFKRAIF